MRQVDTRNEGGVFREKMWKKLESGTKPSVAVGGGVIRTYLEGKLQVSIT